MKNEVKSKLLRQMNERKVFKFLQQKGNLSRAELTKITRISAPTISRTVDSLIKAGLVEELDDKTEPGIEGGRPATLVRLAKESASVIGISLDVDNCQVAMTGLDGDIKKEYHIVFSTPETYRKLLNSVEIAAKRLISSSKGKIVGICLITPGFSDRNTGTVIYSPNLHIMDNKRPAHDLEKLLGEKVLMLSESDAMCLGEGLFGRGKDIDDLAIIDISRGCGVGVMRNGELITSRNRLGMELGHIPVQLDGEECGCGNMGCLETIVTDRAFAKSISRRLGRKVGVYQAVELAQKGKIDASNEINNIIEYLAIGVAVVINMFSPKNIFIYGGHFFDVKQGLFEKFLDRVYQKSFYPIAKNCRISRSSQDKINSAIAGVLTDLTNSLGPTISE